MEYTINAVIKTKIVHNSQTVLEQTGNQPILYMKTLGSNCDIVTNSYINTGYPKNGRPPSGLSKFFIFLHLTSDCTYHTLWNTAHDFGFFGQAWMFILFV